MKEIKMNYADVKRATLFVAKTGTVLTCADDEGEVVFSVGVTVGKHDLSDYLEYMTEGDKLTVTSGGNFLVAAIPPNRAGRMAYRAKDEHGSAIATQTGANPNYKPSREDTRSRHMEAMLRKLTEESSRNASRLAALTRAAPPVARPDTSVLDDEPVIEPVIEPVVESEAPVEPEAPTE